MAARHAVIDRSSLGFRNCRRNGHEESEGKGESFELNHGGYLGLLSSFEIKRIAGRLERYVEWDGLSIGLKSRRTQKVFMLPARAPEYLHGQRTNASLGCASYQQANGTFGTVGFSKLVFPVVEGEKLFVRIGLN
ncbi:uncharacterized protein CIMG_13415 [Coccidioides immitis RS]|uniref:Uncharacterized protein n=1 Tax=Coccidioides immitis (strain RS) TaxID=246410 RepID=A0A0D8JXW1_COCIM|nr:uncharacterized protein CIMG_13415 [Coccidioides immitis RS]KJF61098.1 hypothetical protein CIMG_13415 [Coccidioides immitis RS]